MKLGDILSTTPDFGIDPTAGLGAGSGLSALSQLLRKAEVHGLYFNRKTLKLDGYKFIGCRFDACNLQVASTHFELDHCVIDAATQIEYQGSSVNLIRLFNSKIDWAPQYWPHLSPKINDDGTISILG